MQVEICPGWEDYELLDSGKGKRLERFGRYILSRSDPQIIWQPHLPESEWQSADAVFEKALSSNLNSTTDKGKWIFKNKLPEKWLVKWQELSFWIKLTPFKHTGLFPEQAVQWEWIHNLIANSVKQSNNSHPEFISGSHEMSKQVRHDISVLNLFAYTGVASLVAAQAGAKVTHVDSSKPTLSWARENQIASHLEKKPIRWILDDCLQFMQREIKRKVKYDAVMMDPPVFGHGPDGRVWKFNEHFPELIKLTKQLLSNQPLFLLVNTYAISSSAIMLQNVLEDLLPEFKYQIKIGELALQEKNATRLLSTGIFAKWSRK